MLAFHVFVNVGMTIGVMPVTGLPSAVPKLWRLVALSQFTSDWSADAHFCLQARALMKHIIFCSAVMATFIIDNPQCGGNRVERAQIAAIYLENSHHNQALLEARRALREEGPQAELQLIIALAHMGMEEDSAALKVLVNAIELDPANDQLHGALRSLCEKEAIRAEARSALIKLAKREAASRCNAGDCSVDRTAASAGSSINGPVGFGHRTRPQLSACTR